MARSTRGPRIFRLRHLVAMLTGGVGLGGWFFHDHPSIDRVIRSVVGAAPTDPGFKEAVLEKVAGVAAARDRDRFGESGVFEVRVADLRLDPALFRAGRTLDVRVRVKKRAAHGGETTVWDSKSAGSREVTVGRDDLRFSWPLQPFDVAWTPGDRLTVEVWDQERLLDKKWFEMTNPEDDAFPLRPGPHPLTLVEWVRTPPAEPNTNRIVFEAHRIAAPDTQAPAGVARRPSADDGGTIVIK